MKKLKLTKQEKEALTSTVEFFKLVVFVTVIVTIILCLSELVPPILK